MIDDNSDGEKDEDAAGTVGNAGSINRPLLHSRTDKSFRPPRRCKTLLNETPLNP